MSLENILKQNKMILSTLAYLQKDNKTLMLEKERGYQKGKFNGLGGKFDAGESPEECVIREVYEESGLLANSVILKGFISFPDFDAENDWYVFVYLIKDFKGELIESDEGKLHWVDNDKVLEQNIWPGDKVFIPWLKQDKIFSAKFIYKNGEFISHEVVFY